MAERDFSLDLLKINMTIAGKSTMNQDVFPIENGDFPARHISELRGVQCTPPIQDAGSSHSKG